MNRLNWTSVLWIAAAASISIYAILYILWHPRSVWRQLKKLCKDIQLPIVVGGLATIALSLVDLYTRRAEFSTKSWIQVVDIIGTAALNALLKGLVVGLAVQIVRHLTPIREKLLEIHERVLHDERIIVARESRHRKDSIYVLAFEHIDKHKIPKPIQEKPRNGNRKWDCSISILRYDHIQDLLMSEEYLAHFFRLRRFSRTQYRILVVNDHGRHFQAALCFLRISQHLKIRTCVWRKSEFYMMLNRIRDRVDGDPKLMALTAMLDGNPELSLMEDRLRSSHNWNDSWFGEDADYVLRYLISDSTPETIIRKTEDETSIPELHRNVMIIYRIMSVFLANSSREGPRGLMEVMGDNRPENPWRSERFDWLG